MKLSDIDLAGMDIVYHPDPVLREQCAPIDEFGPALDALTKRMLELMHAGGGVGLAAPQVGLTLRMFVCNPTGDAKDDLVCVNPRLSGFEGGAEADEGCLSLPDVTVPVRRPSAVTLTAQTADGNEYTPRADGLLARIWQHETDHLDGRMIIDYMSTQSKLANARAIKKLEQDYRPPTKRKTAAGW